MLTAPVLRESYLNKVRQGMNTSMLPTRKSNLKTICSECGQLQDRLNAATATLKEIASRQSQSLRTVQDLDEASGERDKVLKKFVAHLQTHACSAAA
jgi:ribosomal protein L44E